MSPLPPTHFRSPWALIRRGGELENGTPFTRMAYLVETIAPGGLAVAVRGYVMNENLKGWSKTLRRIEWVDLIETWRRRPSPADIRAKKLKYQRKARKQAREQVEAAARAIVVASRGAA